MDTAQITIVDNEEASRFELHVGGKLATLASYQRGAETIVFDHTQTRPAFRGRGLAERLVRHALDDARARGMKVVPACWFVADVIERDPSYADLVAA